MFGTALGFLKKRLLARAGGALLGQQQAMPGSAAQSMVQAAAAAPQPLSPADRILAAAGQGARSFGQIPGLAAQLGQTLVRQRYGELSSAVQNPLEFAQQRVAMRASRRQGVYR